MQFGLQTHGSWNQLTAAARWVEEHEIVALSLPDRYFTGDTAPIHDALTQFGALAATTTRIELVRLASPVTFRHPVVLAKAAATIDDITPGRFVLGIGSGWLEREHDVFGLWFGTFTERFEVLEEQLQYVAAALSAGAHGFAGDRYQLEAVPVLPEAPNVRLLVGGFGAHKTPRLAGSYAGEFNVFPGPDIAERIDRMHQAATEAGCDPSEILLPGVGSVLVAPDRDEYERRLAAIADRTARTPEELEAYFALRHTPRGSAQEVAEQLGALAYAGVERFYLQTLGMFDANAVDGTWTLING
jgi:alkanesulfonate monooxygenase SsuD/methylene tetrahydromethanopterin reductase-like flavin-dependent oxidoreductase (luciferase family)